MLPEGVVIDTITGTVSPSTSSYVKRVSELRGIYRDAAALDDFVSCNGDVVAYEVIDYRKPESDLAFGTTIMSPGKIGDEYFMTRGHFHVRRDCVELYYTQVGHGTLLLESRDGEVRTVDMKPGVCAFIPPDWAHRSVNTGAGKLIFVWVCAADAGHEYGGILERGMRRFVVERDGRAELVPHPKYPA
ncbi:MAG: glucose-6-phosphate isomerase [Methylobacteriaceae bacterium]|nr:glucose-6-phosphate isomerase [Methylobacteriaceae bacterium]